MGLVFYDADGGAGSGVVFFENIEGGVPIVVHQLVANDYNSEGITTPGFNAALSVRWNFHLKVKDFGGAIPFTSTPEVRYKIGTVVPTLAYDLISDGGGTAWVPFNGEPSYLIYERQMSDNFGTHVIPFNPGFENYQGVFGNFEPINLNCKLRERFIDNDSYRGLRTAHAVDINLNDGIVVDIELVYVFTTMYISNTETRTIIDICI